MIEGLLRSECDLSQAEVEILKQNIGKTAVVGGNKCVIVNVVPIKDDPRGYHSITVRKLEFTDQSTP